MRASIDGGPTDRASLARAPCGYREGRAAWRRASEMRALSCRGAVWVTDKSRHRPSTVAAAFLLLAPAHTPPASANDSTTSRLPRQRGATSALATSRSSWRRDAAADVSPPGRSIRSLAWRCAVSAGRLCFGAWDLTAAPFDRTLLPTSLRRRARVSPTTRLLCSLQSPLLELASPANLSNTVKTGRARAPSRYTASRSS